jgi:hypothetical protein
METEVSAPLQSRDWNHLARSLTRLGSDAPEGYARWSEWAKAGLTAVRTQDVESVRTACQGCHDAYREDYRLHTPERRVPPAETAAGDSGEGVWGRIKSPPPPSPRPKE